MQSLTNAISFPMEIVFRIYDNCLASGIEAMFAFSMALLSKNEATLLSMKFDQLLAFLNQRVFEVYQVRDIFHLTRQCIISTCLRSMM